MSHFQDLEPTSPLEKKSESSACQVCSPVLGVGRLWNLDFIPQALAEDSPALVPVPSSSTAYGLRSETSLHTNL